MLRSLLVLAGVAVVPCGALQAQTRELAVIESATEVMTSLAVIPLKCIPPALLQDAQGIAIVPNVIKAGFVLGGRHGRGVLLVRLPDGSWSNPVFLTLTGGSIGWQIGVQSTDVVLVFKTKQSLDRILQGKCKLTLGGDAAVAAGPLGRQAEAATDAQLKAEIYSYSRSRGLFVGVSLEGSVLLVDDPGNEALYRVRGIRPEQVVTLQWAELPVAVVKLQAELARQCLPLAPGWTPAVPQPNLEPPMLPPPRFVPTPVPPAAK